MASDPYQLARDTGKGLGISPSQINQLLHSGILRTDVEIDAYDSGESGKGAYIYYDGQASVPGNVSVKRDKIVDDAAAHGYDRGYKDGYEDAREDFE